MSSKSGATPASRIVLADRRVPEDTGSTKQLIPDPILILRWTVNPTRAQRQSWCELAHAKHVNKELSMQYRLKQTATVRYPIKQLKCMSINSEQHLLPQDL